MKNIKIPEKLLKQYLDTGILAIGEYHGVKENYIFKDGRTLWTKVWSVRFHQKI